MHSSPKPRWLVSKNISYKLHNAPDFTNQLEDAAETVSAVWMSIQAQEGLPYVLVYPSAKRAVVIPEYDQVDVDIIKNNMRTVGMTREQYFGLLKRI